jgi:beta-glucosidase
MAQVEESMIEAAFHFPKGFLWGTATAAHQVEGDNRLNDWWAWEQQPGRILRGDKSGLACDWWGGRWKEDLDRAAAGGQNAHRLSVEWSRIEPEPGRWDDRALGFYRDVLSGMRDRGIEPLVTLHHFTNPLWLAEMGGWENEEIIPRFETFTRKTVAALQDLVDFWCTINEPNVYAYSAIASADFPPGRKNILAAFRVMRHQVLAHAAAYHAIHELQPGARVGIAQNYRGLVPHTASPLDSLGAGLQGRIFNQLIPMALQDGRLRFPIGRERVAQAAGTQDYIGVNYYSTDHVSFDLRRAGDLFARRFYPEGSDLSDVGWNANVPDGMRMAIRWADSFGLPIYITENGIEDEADTIRPRYLALHLHQVWKAINTGSPVRGYYHWSLVDNFEWERGWTQRFGLWALDPKTQARTERASGKFYAEICSENGLTSDMVRRYAPEIVEKLFPG